MDGLKEKFKNDVIKKMKEKFNYKNDLAVPKIEKVVINTSFGKIIAGKTKEEQRKIKQGIINDISLLSGQRPVFTFAKKSISNFKLKKGAAIGAKVTLRKKLMNNFLEKLINIALPRSRDFRGISSQSIDEKGNLTIGLKEHIVFPEIMPEKSAVIFGLEITVTTTAKTKKEGEELFKLLGFPIKV